MPFIFEDKTFLTTEITGPQYINANVSSVRLTYFSILKHW